MAIPIRHFELHHDFLLVWYLFFIFHFVYVLQYKVTLKRTFRYLKGELE